MSLIIAHSTEQFEGGFQVLPNLAHRGQVAAAITIIGGTPHSHHILIIEVVFVTLVHQLMGACNQGEIVDVAEFVRHAIAKEPT